MAEAADRSLGTAGCAQRRCRGRRSRLQRPLAFRPRIASFACAVALAASSGPAAAVSATPQRQLGAVLGAVSSTRVGPEETLLDIAYRYRVGFSQLQQLNPQVDAWLPEPGTALLLPTAAIVPDAPHEGLLINVPEMRLYDFTAGSEPEVFAIAIGDAADPTPVGEFRIGAKYKDPVWYVPATIRAEDPELPERVPPGPNNPLGDRWMSLSGSRYGIHGTSTRWSIGRGSTHGCVRMYNDEMQRLYARIPPGTPVRLVYQAVKLGARDGVLYLEAHPDVYARGSASAERVRVDLLVKGLLGELEPGSLDADAIARVLEEARGIPVAVGRAGALR